jgi:hypothetical protein
MERVSMQVWLQRYGALALLVVALVFTVVSSFLSELAAGLESGAGQSSQVSDAPAPSLIPPAQR